MINEIRGQFGVDDMGQKVKTEKENDENRRQLLVYSTRRSWLYTQLEGNFFSFQI